MLKPLLLNQRRGFSCGGFSCGGKSVPLTGGGGEGMFRGYTSSQ